MGGLLKLPPCPGLRVPTYGAATMCTASWDQNQHLAEHPQNDPMGNAVSSSERRAASLRLRHHGSMQGGCSGPPYPRVALLSAAGKIPAWRQAEGCPVHIQRIRAKAGAPRGVPHDPASKERSARDPGPDALCLTPPRVDF